MAVMFGRRPHPGQAGFLPHHAACPSTHRHDGKVRADVDAIEELREFPDGHAVNGRDGIHADKRAVLGQQHGPVHRRPP